MNTPQPGAQTQMQPTCFVFCIYRTSGSNNSLRASDARVSFFNGCHPPGIIRISNSVQFMHLQLAMLKGCSRNKAKLISIEKIKIRECRHLTSLSMDVVSCLKTSSSSPPAQTHSEIGSHRRYQIHKGKLKSEIILLFSHSSSVIGSINKAFWYVF